MKRINTFWKMSVDTHFLIKYGNKEDSTAFQKKFVNALEAQKAFEKLDRQGVTIEGVYEITTTTEIKRIDV